MKRLLSIVLSLALLLGSIPMVISAAMPEDFQTNFAINYLDGKWNNADGQACDTVQVDYQLKGTGLKKIHGAWIAVDLTKLMWITTTDSTLSILAAIGKDKLIVPGASSVSLPVTTFAPFYKLKDTIPNIDEPLAPPCG